MTKSNVEKRPVKGKKWGPNSRTTGKKLRWSGVYFPEDLIDRLDNYADDYNTTRSMVIRTATEIGMRFLERKEKEKQNGR